MLESFDLNDAITRGIINPTYIQEQINMAKRKEILENHPYKIWLSDNGLWNTYLPGDNGRVRKRCKTQKGIEDIVVKYWEKEQDDPTIEDIFNEWNDRRLELGKICINTHERNKQIFNRHFKDIKNHRIKSLTPEYFNDFLEEQLFKCSLSAKGFSNLKCVSKGFLLKAKKNGLITWSINEVFEELDISERDYYKTIKEDYEEVFDEQETAKIIKYLSENLDTKNIAILLMFLTGIRVGELVTLKHVDFNEYSFKVRRTETRERIPNSHAYIYRVKEYPKTPAGLRESVIPKQYWWICKKIENLNPDGAYIFVNDKQERITTNCIRSRLYGICHKLNIYRKSPHKIRKTYGTILMDNNVDRNMVTGLMGHADIEISEKYYHRNRKNLDKKLEIIDSIPEFATPIATLGKSYK